MLYRAIKKLSNGIQAGEVFAGERLGNSALQALLSRGVIVPETGAPLSEFPEFEGELENLRTLGIVDLVQLATSSHPLKARAVTLLAPPQVKRCKCGGK